MKKIFVFLLFLLVFFSVSAKSKFNETAIKGELRKPGVKLVAIDFYMTECPPCDAAIPVWKKLKKEYGDALKLIVVAPQRDDGSCTDKDWHPDKTVCDEDMEIAGAWGVKDFPQAFLYSWHNNDPLVKLGHVKDVEKAIKEYFKSIPRVALDADKNSQNLLPMIEEALITNSKIEVVANESEREQLINLRKESHKLKYDEGSRCELGKEIAANSILKITKQGETLSLKLSSAEKSCTMAAATKMLSGNKGKLKTEIASAVYDLLSQMFGDISTPDETKSSRQAASNFQTGRFGGKNEDWTIGSGEETIVKFESNPSGAVVIADGKIICQTTPCSKLLTQGNHEIEMQKENYLPMTQKQVIKAGTPVKFTLEPDFAWLTVSGNYAVSIKLDGANIGNIPIKDKPISTGNHRIEHTDSCFYDFGENFTVKRGEKKNIRFDLDPRESAVKVYAQDEKGNDLSADVFVDDKKVGKAPGTFKVPFCSKKLVVKNSSDEYSKELLLKERSIQTVQATLKSKTQKSNAKSGNAAYLLGNLQWSNKAPRSMNWNDAVNYYKNLNNDWRLPNIDELRTLIQNHPGTQRSGSCPISAKTGKLALRRDWTNDCRGRDGSNFSKLGDTDWLWSSSTLSDDSNGAWSISFSDGEMSAEAKLRGRYVRCVRGKE